MSKGVMRVLEVLVEEGRPLRKVEIAKKAGITPAAVTKIIRKLREFGIVRRDNGAYSLNEVNPLASVLRDWIVAMKMPVVEVFRILDRAVFKYGCYAGKSALLVFQKYLKSGVRYEGEIEVLVRRDRIEDFLRETKIPRLRLTLRVIPCDPSDISDSVEEVGVSGELTKVIPPWRLVEELKRHGIITIAEELEEVFLAR
ncbi:MAG: helix-turn-helix domain-containing protein [Candidatus Baldrarchaeia archaeon]